MVENFHKLGDPDKFVRLRALKVLAEALNRGEIKREDPKGGVCQRIYTTYSFSPYTPSKAAFMAYMAGAETVGIADRDSVSGAKEFLAACAMLCLDATFGAECLVKTDGTALDGLNLNCPEQPSRAFCVLHGIPHGEIERFTGYFEYYAEKRVERLKKMAEKYNETLAAYGLNLDFDKDIASLASVSDGGVITEDHLLLGIANKILEKYDKGTDTVDFLSGELELDISEEYKVLLKDTFNPGYELDMADILRQDLLPMWIDADEECPDIKEFVRIAHETGAILSYSYTGDEEIPAEELLAAVKTLGFNAVSYSPSRLPAAECEKLKNLCESLSLLPLCADSVSRPRHPFVSEVSNTPEFEYLKETSRAVIGHEKAASVNEEFGMFSLKIEAKFPTLKERVEYFAALAKKCGDADRQSAAQTRK